MSILAASPDPGSRSTGEGGVSPVVFLVGVIVFLLIVYFAYRWFSGGAGSAKRPRSRASARARGAGRARRRR